MKSFACPHCGGEVLAKRKACPHCGASEADGWGEEDTDCEDDHFDYEEYVDREFGGGKDIDQPLTKSKISAARVRFVIWAIIISLCLTAFLPLMF